MVNPEREIWSRGEPPSFAPGLLACEPSRERVPASLTGRATRVRLCVPSMGDDLEVKVLWNN